MVADAIRVPKNIALFFDGTGNRAQERRALQENTNVRKLFLGCANVAESLQVSRYYEGIGTQRFRVRQLIPAATGYGLTRNIKAGYRFIVNNYQDQDRIYIFGFSRGAFTAQSLAGLLGFAGILYPEEEGRLTEVVQRYIDDPSTTKPLVRSYLRSLPTARGEDRRPLRVHMLGLWDSVASIGFPQDLRPAALEDLLAHWSESQRRELPAHITHARHALALHELRKDFAPVLWSGYAHGQSLKQAWFTGAHSDVGGSYSDTSLSDVALTWMAAEARDCELIFDPAKPMVQIERINNAGGVHVEDWRILKTLERLDVRGVLVEKTGRTLTKPFADGTEVNVSAIQRLFESATLPYSSHGAEVRRALEDVDARTLPLFLRAYFRPRLPAPLLTAASPGEFPWWALLSHADLGREADRFEATLATDDELAARHVWIPALLFACVRIAALEQRLRALAAYQIRHRDRFGAVVAADDLAAGVVWDRTLEMLQTFKENSLGLVTDGRAHQAFRAVWDPLHHAPDYAVSAASEIRIRRAKAKGSLELKLPKKPTDPS